MGFISFIHLTVLILLHVRQILGSYCYYDFDDSDYKCEDDTGLSGGAIFGIVCAVLAFLAIVVTCVCACVKRTGSKGTVIQAGNTPTTVNVNNGQYVNQNPYTGMGHQFQHAPVVYPPPNYVSQPPPPPPEIGQNNRYPLTLNSSSTPHSNAGYTQSHEEISTPSAPPSYDEVIQMQDTRKL